VLLKMRSGKHQNQDYKLGSDDDVVGMPRPMGGLESPKPRVGAAAVLVAPNGAERPRGLVAPRALAVDDGMLSGAVGREGRPAAVLATILVPPNVGRATDVAALSLGPPKAGVAADDAVRPAVDVPKLSGAAAVVPTALGAPIVSGDEATEPKTSLVAPKAGVAAEVEEPRGEPNVGGAVPSLCPPKESGAAVLPPILEALNPNSEEVKMRNKQRRHKLGGSARRYEKSNDKGQGVQQRERAGKDRKLACSSIHPELYKGIRAPRGPHGAQPTSHAL
jgi:hypothetical protein